MTWAGIFDLILLHTLCDVGGGRLCRAQRLRATCGIVRVDPSTVCQPPLTGCLQGFFRFSRQAFNESAEERNFYEALTFSCIRVVQAAFPARGLEATIRRQVQSTF